MLSVAKRKVTRELAPPVKLGMVSQWYDPEEGSAGVPATIARSLRRRGLDTSVVTGFPNYPYGKFYPGYTLRASQREVRDSIPVHRVALYPSHERSSVKRIVSYLSFAASASTLGLRTLMSCDVGLVYSTPATAAIPALAAKAVRRVPFVLFIQDLWPETVLASGMLASSAITRRLEWALHRFCNQVYRSAGRIAVISTGMRELLIERGVPPAKIEVVHNWVDEALFRPVALDLHLQAELGIAEQFSVMYAGSLGDLQGLDVAVRAAEMLQDLTDFRLVLVGSGVAESGLRRMVADARLANVIFAGQRPLSEMSSLLRAADVQLITLRDLPLFHATMPSKVQCILSAGRPVISSAPGDVGDLIRRSGAGIACPPEDPAALALAIREMYQLSRTERERLGWVGHEFYRTQLSESVGSARLVRLLEEVCR